LTQAFFTFTTGVHIGVCQSLLFSKAFGVFICIGYWDGLGLFFFHEHMVINTVTTERNGLATEAPYLSDASCSTSS
jgi:hypothetical protein